MMRPRNNERDAILGHVASWGDRSNPHERQYSETASTSQSARFGDLAAFSSAIILGLIAVEIAYESVLRLIAPVPIVYGDAIAVAALGLCVNLASAWLLRDNHDHHHGHDHGHSHAQHDHDDHDHDH